MRSHACLLALGLFATSALHADGSLAHARCAQARLGPDVWSQVIRIENEARWNRYPRTLHALVFELMGVLWFYTDTDGTQSFSLHHGRLAEEKADFGPLLADIEPGFTRWRLVPGAAGNAAGPLPNGCFIDSVAAWRARRARGEETMNPQLLAYYANDFTGHVVLTYATRGHVEVIDPERPDVPLKFSAALAGDAKELVHALCPVPVSHVRLVPLTEPALFATTDAAPGEGTDALPRPRSIVTIR